MQQAVTQAIAGLSERKVQFTYTDLLARRSAYCRRKMV
ncbi:traI domain protein [Escherichia coli P0304816.8]|nr:traI domain protein [Escherichia coli P0304816.8]